jgi:hypothetical protein
VSKTKRVLPAGLSRCVPGKDTGSPLKALAAILARQARPVSSVLSDEAGSAGNARMRALVNLNCLYIETSGNGYPVV